MNGVPISVNIFVTSSLLAAFVFFGPGIATKCRPQKKQI